ncbi:glycosyltransferase [Mycobacterium sp. pV006]|uniref:glycosyltransferase n=1 Tax=Mycobacterium sp. pV006 TaxID=3238983 RepID=UPI00351B5458
MTAEDRRIVDRLPDTFILGASRFVPYKQLDKVIAIGALLDVPVVIAGDGPEEQRLRQFAADLSASTTFVQSPSDALLHTLYARCAVFIFPPVEDFGIMPVEAIAAGAPVVVNSVGGAKESVGETMAGVVVNFEDIRDAADRTRELLDRGVRPSVADVADFDESRFLKRVRNWVCSEMQSLQR